MEVTDFVLEKKRVENYTDHTSFSMVYKDFYLKISQVSQRSQTILAILLRNSSKCCQRFHKT